MKVRIEAALTLRMLAEVDPTCVGGLTSFGVTTLNALRETVSFEKGSNLKLELDSLHGQAMVLAALASISPKLPLGYPSRLLQSVLDVLKKMLLQSSPNPVAHTVEKQAGWSLLSSLLASMPKEELEDQVFDILSLWAPTFTGNQDREFAQNANLIALMSVWEAAIDALAAFVKCFASPDAVNNGILLQPVLVYLSRALSIVSLVKARESPNLKPSMDKFVIKILIAYQSLPDPMAYKSDHPQIIQLCTTPFRDAPGCEESSCLRLILDKRDAWLGPWIPGRDWFEDELRAFQGGKDGLMPCVWESGHSSFPQPETISKTVVNQKLLCFGILFAFQDNNGMLSLLGTIEQCSKAGKKQQWHAVSVTNICVALLAGLKALLALRPRILGQELLSILQTIFQSILAEGNICASQRRASAEGLGLLARVGNDIFTARLTRSLLGELTAATDTNYAGSIAFALGCIHRCAGGMALSSLVPSTVSSISLLTKSSVPNLQIWSLHGLLLTIEAAGLSYVSHVQATLGLAMEILLSEENGWVDLQQGVGRLVNAIVAVLGPELAPGSIFFSRSKSVIAEISSWQETATLLESVRFSQQLVLFAPQAVPVHSHVQSLLPTLSSRQPILRHLAISTLRHLIEKDPESIKEEQIEENLFHMLDEETDSEIGNLVQSTIMRLLYATCPSCPSHWISVCRNMVLSTSRRKTETERTVENDISIGTDGETSLAVGGDDETMVAHSRGMSMQDYPYEGSSVYPKRDKHLRYRTRVFAAECLRHLPAAVGNDPSHFDLSLARSQSSRGHAMGDWLVIHVQELISLAYQISTIQFERLQPIGVELLSIIIDKYQTISDPELPGHLLLEQYQAQLVSAVRTALDTSSGPILLEAGLQLATKILTSGIITSDQAAIRRIYSLISRPLDDFNNLYYPSFAEWVSCKIKVRLLAAHASLKCYTYAFLRRHNSEIPEDYAAFLPLFAKGSMVLGNFWIRILKDYSYIFLRLHLRKKWNPFLDGIQSPLVASKLQPCLEEAWPVILQALALDAVPANLSGHGNNVQLISKDNLISGYGMVELSSEEFRFLWGFSLLVLFCGQDTMPERRITLWAPARGCPPEDLTIKDTNPPGFNLYEVVLPVFQFLSSERFFSAGYVTVEICQELVQVFTFSVYMGNAWNSLAISVLSQIVKNCPEDFLEEENFTYATVELCLAYIFNIFQCANAVSTDQSWEDLVSPVLVMAKTLVRRFVHKKQLKSVALAMLLISYHCVRASPTELCFLKVNDYVQSASSILKNLLRDICEPGEDAVLCFPGFLETSLNVIIGLIKDCIKGIHLLGNKKSDSRKLIQTKLAFSFEQIIILAKLAHQCLALRTDGDPLHFTLLKHCTECIRSVLGDTNMQVQAIGLQVLKGMLQRETSAEDICFLTFFTGEVIEDIFSMALNMLKRDVTKESAVIITECLRIFVLLQTLSKSSNCRRGYMTLLVEVILRVFSASSDYSEGAVDIRSISIKLVSHLVQIPSSAVHFKDVLLSMPASQRQQLQDIVRASVAQDHNAMQTKSVTPSLEIKLPASAEGIKEKDSPASTKSHSLDSTVEEHEEEDDWDTFQSFPASSSAAATDPQIGSTPEEGDIIENSEFEKYTGDGEDIKLASGDMEALSNMVQKEVVTEVVSDVVGEKNIMGESLDLLREDNVDEPFDRQHWIDEVVPSEEKELTEVQLSECLEASDESNFVEGQRLRNDSTSDRADLEISPAAAPVELLDIGKHYDGGGLKDTDPVVNANEDTEKETLGEKRRNNQRYAGQDSFLVKHPDTSHSSEEEVIQLQPSEHLEESNESNIGESHRLREDDTSPIGLEVSSVTTSSKLLDIGPHSDVGGVTTGNLDVPVNGDSVNQILDGESRNEKYQDVGHC
ncbi:protein SWEETIE isoform X2 [Syzygium oleosum]|uniref:protein SWEETIE isoform X2 n=1 Tax=Syzygium oleosum TaxID=219896 RepID=UPI0024BA1566|nr:protein SWEETIE isoform X2 [Syzygium oleosum]